MFQINRTRTSEKSTMHTFFILFSVTVLLTAGETQAQRPTISDQDTKLVAEIDQLIQILVAQDRFSGAVLIARDGVPIFRHAYGQANKAFDVPNRIDTKFAIHSMNKMFTGVAVMQLVEQGKLSLEDPLARYIANFPDQETAKKIRIKHLLTHTSGLGSFINEAFYTASRSGLRTIDDMMAFAWDEGVKFEPGTQWAYSQTGFLVLGKVIEVVTGTSYYAYVREHIFRRAGMVDTDNYELDLVTPNLAIGYEREITETGVVFRTNQFKYLLRGSSAAGAYSTVDDLLKFDRALHANKLVGADYVAMITSAKPAMNAPNYGYGFDVEADRQVIGHRGTFQGISSNMDIFPSAGYTAIILSNYTDGRTPIVEKIRTLIVGAH